MNKRLSFHIFFNLHFSIIVAHFFSLILRISCGSLSLAIRFAVGVWWIIRIMHAVGLVIWRVGLHVCHIVRGIHGIVVGCSIFRAVVSKWRVIESQIHHLSVILIHYISGLIPIFELSSKRPQK